MEDKKAFIINYIKEKLKEFTELGKTYSEEKINTLAEKLISTNKTKEEIVAIINNRFSYQIRKINHNKHLASLKEHYIASINKLKRGKNCYLLSYKQGNKILEQAFIEEIKPINPYLTLVNLNNKKQAYRRGNSIDNDYELIMSDIAFILNIPYAPTYRIFDKNMNPIGVLNETFNEPNSRSLNFEEVLQFIKEESPEFNLKEYLIEYHDQKIKHGLKEITAPKAYKENIEYVFNLFKALPDITKENYNELKQSYLNMKIFELLTNSLNNNLINIGLIVNKTNKKYTYKLSPLYNKCVTSISNISSTKTICNFFIVEKKQLLHTIIVNYYGYVKVLLSLIIDNKATIVSLIDQIIKEHLDYEEYNKYHQVIVDNITMINEEVVYKKLVTKDTLEDHKIYNQNNDDFQDRIAPFIDNYVVDDNDQKGSVTIITVIAFVLLITILLIIFAIYLVSKVEM